MPWQGRHLKNSPVRHDKNAGFLGLLRREKKENGGSRAAPPPLQYLIVGTQRTGSSALGEAVGLHPNICCGWEWTLRVRPWSKLRVAERALRGDPVGLIPRHKEQLLREFTGDKEVLGFRWLFRSSDKWRIHPRFSAALWIDRLEAHVRWLASRPDIHVVHLVRRDNMAWLRSKALSAATGLYVGAEYPEDARAFVSVASAIRRVEAKTWVDSRLTSLSTTNPYHRVVYEDFLQDNRACISEVVRFLGCEAAELPSLELRVKPQSRAGSATQIENFGAVRDSLFRRGLLDARV